MRPLLCIRWMFILTFLLALQPAKGLRGISFHLVVENGETVIRFNEHRITKERSGPILLHIGSPDQYQPQRYLIHLETLPPITEIE